MISFFKVRHPFAFNWFIEFGFEPRDMWVGLLWDMKYQEHGGPYPRDCFHAYVCLVPCFVLHVWEE